MPPTTTESHSPETKSVSFLAADGYNLHGIVYQPRHFDDQGFVILNGATAVPQQFYRRFAMHIAKLGCAVLTYDYRGFGLSKPGKLRGFESKASDWGLLDMPAALNWVQKTRQPNKIYLIGHSAGGQQAGLLEDNSNISAMLTVASQSGFWNLQGGSEKYKVWFMTKFLIPCLSRLVGYFPWSKFSNSQDLPKQVALQWSRWCQSPGYLMDDPTLPIERYTNFKTPIKAFSIEDDMWGTPTAVRAMMSAYPNVEFAHITPKDYALKRLGHMGYFRTGSEALWDEAYAWLNQY